MNNKKLDSNQIVLGILNDFRMISLDIEYVINQLLEENENLKKALKQNKK